MPMSGLDKALLIDGTQDAVASRLRKYEPSITQQHFSYWLKNGLPRKRIGIFSQAYDGEISRQEFEADVFRTAATA